LYCINGGRGFVFLSIGSEPDLYFFSVFVQSFHLLDLQLALGYVALVDTGKSQVSQCSLKKLKNCMANRKIGSVITIMHLPRHDATRPDT
jgi:hypothetical protein